MVLDVLAWLPYGIIHFAGPVFATIVLFIFGPPGTIPVWARSFGYMNLIGVVIQLCFPCSPPCMLLFRDLLPLRISLLTDYSAGYEKMFGLAPANYSMSGSPAGLGRIDALFGIDLYTSNFIASPLVFGAFPSLHAGTATTEALFLAHTFPKLRPFFITYVLWIWWATMYLSHHYAVDLVGGSLRKFHHTPHLISCGTDSAACSRWSGFLHRQSQLPTSDPTRQRLSMGL